MYKNPNIFTIDLFNKHHVFLAHELDLGFLKVGDIFPDVGNYDCIYFSLEDHLNDELMKYLDLLTAIFILYSLVE